MGKYIRVSQLIGLGFLFYNLQFPVFAQQAGPINSVPNTSVVVTSGSQVFDAKNLNGASSLSVAPGATAIIDFGQSPTLNIVGDINNAGYIYAVSSNPAINSANFSSLNITNNAGALLSSVLPSGGFSGMGNLVQNLNLSLNALNNIVNAGTISSAANLSFNAGNSISNTSVISSVQNINMVSGIAGMVNTGLINSIAGNINISNLASQNLLINNTNGTLQALLGSVNLSTLAGSSIDKLNLSIIGGDVLAKTLNLNTQEGIAAVDISKLTGVVNVSAGEVHITSRTDNLQLGSMNITGDPTFFNPTGSIQISGDLIFSGQNLLVAASGDITTFGTTAWNINTSSAGNGGAIMMIAGVAITPNTGGTGGTTGGVTPDNSTTLILGGASTTGGNIDLTQGSGIASLNSSSTSNGSGGNIALLAYGGTGKGSITLPTSVTINSGTALSNNFTLNGNVSIIAGASSGQAITVGNITTNGNTVTASNNNGLINIFSATPAMYQSVNGQTQPTSFTGLNGNQYATQTYIIVTDATNIAPSQVLTINPTGANPETVTVSSTYVPGSLTVALENPLQQNHSSSDYITVSVASLSTFPNAGPAGPILQNGGIFAAGALQNGNISVGTITSGANVVIGTNPAASSGNGQVNLNGSITLTQYPLLTQNYNDTPVVQVTGQQVTVPSSSVVSSLIYGCSFCQDVFNIYTPNLSNSGTISGSYINIQNNAASNLTVLNSGSIIATDPGIGPASTIGNPWVNIQSAGSISFGNVSSTIGNISAPLNYSVISVSAADTNSINFIASQIFSSGNGSVISFSAQGTGASVNFAAGASLVSSPTLTGFGGPFLSISSPTLNFANGSAIQGVGSNMVFTSGALVQSPQPLTINVAGNGSAQIVTGANNKVVMRPTDGQNIHFTSSGSAANLAFSGGTVYLFTGTNRATGVAGSIVTDTSKISVTAPSSISAVDPNGGITGIAFEPYVGPALTFPNSFTLFGTYTYPQVLLLMAPLAQTGLFQNLGTYTQGAFLGPGNPSATLKESYVIIGAARFTIQAAKQMGFQVTAGAYSQNPDKSVNVPPTEAEIDYALAQAVKYGNVMDMVIGNECIVGGTMPQASTTSLIQAMNYAQNQRNTITTLTSTTLPVTTRQTYGVLSGVTSYQSTVDLLNGCKNCQATYGLLTADFAGTDGHVYADVYPYYDGTNGDGTVVAASTVGYLVPGGVNATSITSVSQSNFQLLVTASGSPPAPPTPPTAPPPILVGIQADLNGTISAFTAKSINPQLWVAETGWATASTQSTNTITTALPNNAPQANLQWASYYYPDMQAWSQTNKSSNSLGYQIPINGYFEAYNEPWKYTATTWQGGEPNFGVWSATGTNLQPSFAGAVPSFQLTGIAQAFNLPVFNMSNTAPLPKPQTSSFSVSSNMASPVVTVPAPNLNLAVFNASIANANSALLASRGTILPTDINPELDSSNESGTRNFAATNALGAASQATLAGNVNLNSQQIGMNPAESLITFSGSNLLLAPDHNMTVNTNLAQIQLDEGAAVMMIQTGGELAILALHDDHSGAVRVTVDGQTMHVPVGRQLVLTKDHNGHFDNVNPSAIGYRNLSNGKVGTLKAFQSEFSLPTALSTTAGVKQLIKSGNKEERDLAQKLLKTAAAMSLLGKNKAPFKASH